MKIRIEPESPPGQVPYQHLKPIVRALIANGNEPSSWRGGSKPDALGFALTQGGWICSLQKKIDFALVEREFDLPISIKLSPSYDAIACEKSWVEIRGGVA